MNLVLALIERQEIEVAEAESPRLVVVGRSVRYRSRLIRQRVEVRLQLTKTHPLADGDAVVDDVEIRFLEVDYAPSRRILDVRVGDVPLAWHSPIEHLCTRRNLDEFHRHIVLEIAKSSTKPVAGDAPADGIQVLDYTVCLVRDLSWVH